MRDRRPKIKIGILNIRNGKHRFEKECRPEEAMEVFRRATRWFDRRKTIFGEVKIYDYFVKIGEIEKYRAVATGKSLINTASVIIGVEEKDKVYHYELYLMRQNDY